MGLRLVKRSGEKAADGKAAGVACLVLDGRGGVVEAAGWESLEVEPAPSSLGSRPATDSPLHRGMASTVAEARRSGRPESRMVEVETDRPRMYALVAAPLPGPGRSGRIVLTVTELGGPRAGQAEGQVIRHLGHDLRTPLTSISGAVELLQSGRLGGLHPQQVRVLGLMQKGVESMVRLIDDATAPYRSDRTLAAVLGAGPADVAGDGDEDDVLGEDGEDEAL